jgi:hypothetical protein
VESSQTSDHHNYSSGNRETAPNPLCVLSITFFLREFRFGFRFGWQEFSPVSFAPPTGFSNGLFL